MPTVRDAADRRWTVRRLWWPFSTWQLDLPDWGGLFVIGIVLSAPLAVVWPFWLLAKAFGVPWILVVRREGKEVRREKIAGWTASGERMAEIVEELRSEGGPQAESGAVIY